MLMLTRHNNADMTDCTFCIAGGTDTEGQRKQRLLSIFGDWTDMVTDLIRFVRHSEREHFF